MENKNIGKKSKLEPVSVKEKGNQEKGLPEILEGDYIPVYSDRILKISLGPGVSKLHFGEEVGPNHFKPTYSICIPTQALVDGIDFIAKALSDEDVQQEFANSFEHLKDRMSRGQN